MRCTFEIIGGNITANDGKIFETLLLSFGVDVLFLSGRIGEGGNLGIREDFSKIKGK